MPQGNQAVVDFCEFGQHVATRTTRTDKVNQVKGDLLDKENLKDALETINPTHVFITTWMLKDT